MDSLDNIFSIPIPTTDNHIDDNWLLRVSNPNCSSSALPLTQQLLQQHYYNSNNNYNDDNNNTFDFQTTNTNINGNNINTNTNINDIINDSMENPQIKEQLLLLQHQQIEQQQQVQQQVLDYQILHQQSYQLRQQQFYIHDNNNINTQPSVISQTIPDNENNNNNINPVSDQQILISMKTIEPINSSTITDSSNTTSAAATTAATKQPKKKTTKTTTITTTTTTSTKEDNNTAAAEDRSKFYHKKHREKKKGYVKEMEDKIAALAFENKQLAKENKSLKINGESVEGHLLFDEDSTNICNESTEITMKMKDALDNNDERSLIYLLNQFHISMPKLILEIVKYTDHIFHPNFQALLNIISYVPHTEPVRYDILTGPGSDIWIEEFKKDAKLTNEQSIKLDELRIEFKTIEAQCLAERLELDKEVKRIFNTNFMFLPKNPLEITQDDLELPYSTSNFNQPALDLCQSLEIICKLNTLKNKVVLGRINTLYTFAKICRILTPVQEAKFLIVTHQTVTFDFSFEMLNLVWKNLTTSNSLFGIANGLEKMVHPNHNNNNNNNSNNNNNNNNVTPFSLKPASFNIPSLNK